MLDAVLPVIVLIGLLATCILLFGTDATGGPLQVCLLISAAFAGIIAFKNGHPVAEIRAAAIGGVTSAMGAIFILLAVGALIGTWNMAGTIPTIVYYGVELLSANWFYAATAVICAVVGLATGSSWTTAGTVGVAFVGMANELGLSTAIAAGAVLSGAYLGDKLSPLSETTVLVPQLVGPITTGEHIKAMIWTSGPSFGLALIVFLILGFTSTSSGAASVDTLQAGLEKAFDISWISLLPLLVLLVLTIRKAPPFIALLGSALFAGILAVIDQPTAVRAFVNEPSLNYFATSIKAILSAMANGFVSSSGTPAVDDLFSRGGMSGMLMTIWLILGALSFAAIMEHAGFLAKLMSPLIERAKSNAGLTASVLGTAIGLNVIAGDQYVADVMPARAYRRVYSDRGLSPHVLSRSVEDSGTVTSSLVPWNSCGAYMSGVLGVSTFAYFPYAVFNLASPVIDLLFAVFGLKMDKVEPGWADRLPAAAKVMALESSPSVTTDAPPAADARGSAETTSPALEPAGDAASGPEVTGSS